MHEDAIAGIPAGQLADFGGYGVSGPNRGLTINVYDPATETAEKFVVRYDPGAE